MVIIAGETHHSPCWASPTQDVACGLTCLPLVAGVRRNIDFGEAGNLGGTLKRSTLCVLVAPLLLVACAGPPRGTDVAGAGPNPVAAVADAGPTLSAAEAESVLEAAVNDRASDALAASLPDGPSLDAAKSTKRHATVRSPSLRRAR